ncbi:MAG: hypothetical protein AAGG08_10050, partial [Actinomycetota bacterium]
YAPTTAVTCNGINLELSDFDELVPIASADPGLQAVVESWSATIVGAPARDQEWYVLANDGEEATMVAFGESMSWISAENGRNGWIWAGASAAPPCEIRVALPEGLGIVEWTLDPSVSLDTTSTEIALLATERGCASGQPMGERLLAPQVIETDAAIEIALAVIPLTEAECPSNPSTSFVIELDEPVGDREIRDGLDLGSITDLVPMP